MNRLPASTRVLALFLALLVPVGTAPVSLQGASDSWNIDADGNWVTNGSWLSNIQTPGSTTLDNSDIATFSFTLAGGRIVTVDATRYIGGISFGNTSAFGYTLSGGSLILNNGGVIQTLAGNGNHTDTISSPIVISGTSAATAAFTANATSAASLLSIGAVTGSATAGNTTTLTLNGTNTGLNAVTGVIGDGAGTGKLALTKAGAGTWLLTGQNTFTGDVNITGGTLIAGVSASGNAAANTALGFASNTRTITVGTGSDLNFSAANVLSTNFAQNALPSLVVNAGTVTNISTGNNALGNVTLNAGTLTATGGHLTYGAFNLNGTITSTGTSSISAAGNARMMLNSSGSNNVDTASSIVVNSGTLTIAATLADLFAAEAKISGINKSGVGTLDLRAANTFSGSTTVTAGNLTLSNALALENSALVTIGAGTVTLSGHTAPTFGGLSGATGNLASVITNYSTVTALTLNTVNPAVSFTYGGVIANGSGNTSLTKTGTGTQVLNGGTVNSFTGGLNISRGTLTLDYSNLATPTDLVNSANALNLSGSGALTITGKSTATTTQTFTGATLGTGVNTISINRNGVSGSANLILGALTITPGSATIINTGTAWVNTTLPVNETIKISAGGSVPALPGAGLFAYVNAGLFYRSSAAAGSARYVAVDEAGNLLGQIAGSAVIGVATAAPTVVHQIAATTVFSAATNTSSYALVLNAGGAGRSLTLSNGGTYTLNGIVQNQTTNGITITAGTGISNITIGAERNLVINMDNAAPLVINAPIVDNGGGASAVTIASTAPSGTTPGTVTFGGANTFTGRLSVVNSRLSVATLNDISTNGVLGNSALSVILGGSGGQTGTLASTAGSALASTKPFTLTTGGTGAFVVPASGTVTLTGLIDGGGGLTKTGNGILILSGPNTYSGITTQGAGGELRGAVVGASLTPISPFGTSTISLGGFLGVRASGTVNTTAETVTIGNNVVVTANSTIDVNRPGATSTTKTMAMGMLTIGNQLTVTNGQSYILSFGATTLTGNATFNPSTGATTELILGAVGQSGGPRSLTKTGAGILSLNAANTYSGATNINVGTLQLTTSTATLGDTTAGTTVAAGAALKLRASMTLDEALTLSGTGVGVTRSTFGALLLNVNNGSFILNGPITLSGGAAINTFLSPTATIQIARGIDGTGDLTLRASAATNGGALYRLQGASTYSGNTFFSTKETDATGITVQNEINNALPTTTVLNLQSSLAAENIIYRLNGFNQTLAGLQTNGTGTLNAIVGGSATLSTLTVNNSADFTFGGTLGNSGTDENNLALTKTGANILILSGANTYTGGTTITTGTLQVGAGGATGALGSGPVINNAALVFNRTGSLTVAGAISGNGSITKQGSGTVVLSSATSSNNGSITVNGGTLSVNPTALATATGITVGSTVTGSVLDLYVDGVAATTNLSANTNLVLGGAVSTGALGFQLGAAGSPGTSDRLVLSGTGALTVGAGGGLINAQALAGFGVGSYSLITGPNAATYTGTLGTGVLPSGFGYTIDTATTGTVNLVVAAAPALMWWKGDIGASWNTVNSGGLATNWDTSSGGGIDAAATPGTGSTVNFSATSAGNFTTTLDAAFSIAGLNITNNVASAVTINPGTGGTLTIGSGGIDVQTGAPTPVIISAPMVLGASQTWTVTDLATSLSSSGGITGTANLIKAGAGIVTLSGTNSYVGTTTVNAGVLAAGATNGFNAISAHTIGASGTLRLNGFGNTIGSLAGAVGAIVENGAASGDIDLTAGGDDTGTIFAGTLRDGGVGTLGLTKVGSGSLTLSGLSATAANNYSRLTTLNAGTLVLNTGDVALTGGLTLGTPATTTAVALDIDGINATFGGALTMNINSITASTITVDAARTLTINGGLSMANNTDGATNALTFNGGGALVVTGVALTVGNNTTGANSSSKAILDLSALSSVTATLSGNMSVQLTGDNNGADASSLILSNTANTLTATALGVGVSGTGSVNRMTLGAGTNIIRTNTLNIGTGGRDSGVVSFGANVTGSVDIRDVAGTGPVTFNMGTTGGGTTGYDAANVFDVAGHNAFLQFGAVNIGTQLTRGGEMTNVFSFDQGTFSMTSLNLSSRNTAGGTTSTFNIAGGTVTSGAITMATTGAAAGVAVANLNITGSGNVTMSGNITKVGGAGTDTANFTLDGATAVLDMGGFNLGGAGANALDSAILAAGTLQNVGEFNGGATLVKTTSGTLTMGGTNTYTGGTAINEGTVIAVGGANNRLGSGGLTIGSAAISGLLQLGNVSGPSDQTFTALATSGSGTANAIVGGNATASTLTINQSTNTAFAGNIGGTGTNQNNLNLVKSGVGELSISGAAAAGAAWTGTTAVNGGRLFIDHKDAFAAASTSLTVADGAEFALRGTGLTANQVYGFGASAGNKITVGSGAGTAVLGFRIDGGFNTRLQLLTGQTMTVTTGSTFQTAVYVDDAPTAASYILIDGADNNSLDAGSGTFDLNPVVFNGGSFTYALSNVIGGGTYDRWILTPTAQAATADVWWKGDLTGIAAGVWSASGGVSTNWDTSAGGGIDALVPPDSGSIVHFSATSAGNFATTLGGNLTIQELLFETGASDISVGGAHTLTIGNTIDAAGITMLAGAPTNASFSANVALAQAQSFNIADSGDILTFTGGLSGTGALGINDNGSSTGTMVLGGVSGLATYSGATNLVTGRLILQGGATNRLPTATALTMGNATLGAILQLGDAVNGASGTSIGNLNTGAATTNAIVGGFTTASILSINQTSTGTFRGIIGGGGTNENQVGITKSGSATLVLNGGNTYTGATTITNGTLQLGAAGSISGTTALAINAAAGSTAVFDVNGRTAVLGGAITLGGGDATAQANISDTVPGGLLTLGGNVTYDATNNPLGSVIGVNLNSTATIARTITVNDSSSTTTELTLDGTLGNNHNITIAGAGSGVINGAWTITGTNRGITFDSTGIWTINAATGTAATGDWNINSGVINATVTNALNAGDNVLIDGTGVQDSAVVNISGTAGTSGVHQGAEFYIRNGGRVNVTVANGISNGTLQLLIGDTNSVGTGPAGRLDLAIGAGTINVGANGVQVGGAGGNIGNITGTGLITTAGAYSLRGGSIEAGITLAGTGNITKVTDGTLTFSGTRGAGAFNTFIQEGNLILDYTTNNASKIGGVLTLGLTNANVTAPTALTINANMAGTTQSVTSTTISNSGDVLVDINDAGVATTLSLGAITRSVVGGTVSFDYSSVDAIATTTSPATGALGWATVTTGGTTRIGAISGGNIVQATTTTQNNVAAWGSLQNIINTAGYSGTLDPECNTIASLTFDAAAASTVTIGSDSLLIITSGGILVNSGVGANGSTITGGSILGSTTAPLGELMIHQNNTAGLLTINSDIINSSGITKSGLGTVVLGGNNTFLTGSRLSINEGTVELAGGNAIGDSTTVMMRRGTTLDLNNSNETIGNLSVDTANLSSGTIDLGSGTLTVNQATDANFTGGIIGTGGLVKNGTGFLSFQGDNTFSGPVVINGGVLRLEGEGGFMDSVTTFTLNASELLSHQNSGTERNRIGDGADIILNNTAGTNGLRHVTNQGNTKTENIGDIRIGAGHNVVTAHGSATNAIAVLQADTLTRLNTASQTRGTVLVRGNALGASSGTRGTIAFDSTAQATVNGFEVGGGGAAASLNISIIPWMIGDLSVTGLGNTFVTNVDATVGLRPLASTEYTTNAAGFNALPAAAASTNNVRFTTGATLTGTATAINSLVIDAATDQNVNGPANAIAITTGAILAASSGTTITHTLGGFTAITTGGGRDYTTYVTSTTGTLTISSPLTSAVPLVKSGAGTLSLTNSGNLFTDVYLNQGNLLIDNLNKVNGTTNALRLFGGGVRLAAGFTGDLSTKPWDINTGGGTIDVSLVTAGTTFANGIVDTTVNTADTLDIFTRSSATGSIGQLTIQGASTFTGTTVIRNSGINSGLVNGVVLNGTTNAAINGNLVIGNAVNIDNTFDAVVALGASDQIVDTASITFRGVSGEFAYFKLLGFNETVAGISDTTATGVVENRETDTVSASGTLTLNSSADFGYNGFLGDVNTGLADANKLILIKKGTGTQTLSGGQIRHSGTTTIVGGGLTLTDVTEWQSDITNDATLSLNQTGVTTRTHSNAISGSGTLVKLGSGTVTLSSATSSYSGVTNIEQGILSFGASANLGDASATNDIRIANGATLQSTGADVDLGVNRDISLSGAAAIIEVTPGNVLTAPGIISGDDCTPLFKTGTGTLVLTGANTYEGATTISAGTLQLGTGVGGGTTGSLNPLSSITNNATLIFNRSNTLTQGTDFAPAISGTGAVTQTGSGTTILNGTNTYSGVTTVEEGTLRFAKQTALYNNQIGGLAGSWTAANIIVNSGATVAFNVGGTDEFTTGSITTLLTNLSTVTDNGLKAGSNVGFDTTNASGGNFTVADTIADSTGTGGGAVGVTKLGTNTLILTADNTYTGGTTISAGTLQLGTGVGGSTTGAVGATGNIVNNGALVVNRSNAYTIGNDISGATGTFEQTGTGTTTLTGTNTYSGTTTVSDGILLINGNNAGATGDVTVGTGATLGGTGTVGNLADTDTLIENGGTITAGTVATGAPVDGNLGTLTFNGDLALESSSSVWLVDLVEGTGVGTGADRVNVGGALSLNSATLDINFGGTFVPYQVYTIAQYGSGGLFGTFSGLSEGAFADPGNQYRINYASDGMGGSGNFITLTAVPEPGTFGLLGLALAGLAFLRFRKRRQEAGAAATVAGE